MSAFENGGRRRCEATASKTSSASDDARARAAIFWASMVRQPGASDCCRPAPQFTRKSAPQIMFVVAS